MHQEKSPSGMDWKSIRSTCTRLLEQHNTSGPRVLATHLAPLPKVGADDHAWHCCPPGCAVPAKLGSFTSGAAAEVSSDDIRGDVLDQHRVLQVLCRAAQLLMAGFLVCLVDELERLPRVYQDVRVLDGMWCPVPPISGELQMGFAAKHHLPVPVDGLVVPVRVPT